MTNLNGYSYGQIEIPGGRYPVISLPNTNFGSGLVETLIPRKIEQELIGVDISNPSISTNQNILGFDLIWEFHYEDFITGNDLYNKFYPIIRAAKNRETLVLTPRIDVPERFFTVLLMNENLTLALTAGGSRTFLHKGAVLTFKTVQMQADPNWYLVPEPETNFRVYINEFQYNA